MKVTMMLSEDKQEKLELSYTTVADNGVVLHSFPDQYKSSGLTLIASMCAVQGGIVFFLPWAGNIQTMLEKYKEKWG
jgi:hypothetical protein